MAAKDLYLLSALVLFYIPSEQQLAELAAEAKSLECHTLDGKKSDKEGQEARRDDVKKVEN